MNRTEREVSEVGSLENWSGAGAWGKDLEGVEDLFLGVPTAQWEGKPERLKYPGGPSIFPVCYVAF